MDCKITNKPINNSDTNPTLFTFNIKTELDHPELVHEADLISENYAEKQDHTRQPLRGSSNRPINDRYSCPQCNEEFPELKYIQVHEAVHSSDLHCPVCDRIFRSEKYFVPHIQVHLKDPLRCQECPEIFFDKRSYNLHLYSHRKIKTYTCDYCLKEWPNKKDLTVHIRVHTNERPYSCAMCSKSFKQRGGLSSHISTVHSSKDKVVKEKISCSICDGSYSSVSSLNKHVKKVHETGKTFPCRKCGETFLNFQKMKEHRRQSHPELAYTRVCSLCNEIFSCRETFTKHKGVHNEIDEQIDKNESTFGTSKPCYLCGKQIQGATAFSKHQQFHLLMTDDEMQASFRAKKFVCKICKRQFNFKKNLFQHMDVHSEKKFECKSHCSEKFTYLGIRLHLQWFFDKFHCAECNETFVGRRNLKKHNYEKHKTTLKISCKICGCKFKYRQLLIMHLKMRHSLKCNLCLKKFITHLELKSHIKMKHKVDIENGINLENKLVKSHTRKYNCKVCKHPAETMQFLKDHMKVHRKACYQCDNCKKHFLYFRNFMFHVRQNICLKYFDNTKGTSRPNCLVCKKEFKTVCSLINHNRRHNTIYKCEFCNSKFKQKDLQEHINRQHLSQAKLSCNRYSNNTLTSEVKLEDEAACFEDMENTKVEDVS